MTPRCLYTGSMCDVEWMLSMQPPWSIAMSTITLPGRIFDTIALVTTVGAFAAGIVKGTHFEKIEGDMSLLINGKQMQKIGGDQSIELDSDQKEKVVGNLSLQVGKDTMTQVGGNVSLQVGQSRNEKI